MLFKLLCRVGIHNFKLLNTNTAPYTSKYTKKGMLECTRCKHQEVGEITEL